MAMDTRGYENLLRKQTGKAVRPVRYDGYVNLINRYGTSKDIDEQYFFSPEPDVPDDELELFYEGNGLFAKIIDTPAEEAVKHGFELEDLNDDEIKNFYESALDELDWEEVCMTGIKWARLYGGSLAVMLINDGHGLEEPLDWDSIESIDDIVVYDRSLIVPDQSSIYKYEKDNPFGTRGSRLGTPEWYEINSANGNFRVHDSRVLAFRNGVLPQRATHQNYQLWGIPEYVRINRAIRNAEVAHESAPKMLSKSVQPVYKMKNLSELLATTDGEDKVLRRLRLIDMARSFLNSITIDQEGEDYSFASFAFNGVDQVITSSCNWLSALTSIPQTILFGRSPAGMNATGDADLENYYNYVERIQKRMVRSNLRYLLSVIFTAGLHTGEIDHIPEFSIKFSPLWSMTESEQVALDLQKAQVESARAQTASVYIQNQVIDPGEVRKSLAESDEFDIETMLDDYTEEELEENAPKGEEGGMPGEGGLPGMPPMGGAPDGGGMPPMGGDPGLGQEAPAQPAQAASEPASEGGEEGYALQGNSPETAPEATKLPQDQLEEDPDHEDAEGETTDPDELDWITLKNGVHVPLDPNGKALGGPVEGADFSGAESENNGNSGEEKSESSSETTGGSGNSSKRVPVQGKDITTSYDGPGDIKSVIHAQGFDGLPRLASQEEFDKAVKASHFIAQRSYSASSSEILEEYKDQLYNGEWYVECTEGGSQYGQGMYCAADYNGELTKGIKKEMDHYSGLYSTLTTDQEDVVFTQLFKMRKELIEKYGEEEGNKKYKAIDKLSPEEFVRKYPERFKGLNIPCSRIETFTLDPDAKIITYDDLNREYWGLKSYEQAKYEDVGAFAAAMGYDAINAESHGQSGSYTVILNRSKCIFLADDKRTDAEDKSMITFRLGKDGKIDAIRDGKVIGWVLTQENSEESHGDAETDTGTPARHGKPDYEAPVPAGEASSWLVQDLDPLMTNNPDTSSPDWTDDEIKRRIRSVGVLVVDQFGKILTGVRKGGSGENYGLLGGPGGHVEPGESLEDAAIRETYEEFGIVPKDLMFISLGRYEEDSGMIPAIFLCTEWAGRIYPVDGEMENIRFRTIDDIETHKLFGPFESSLEILEKELTSEDEDGNMTVDGGPGSGNFGHGGRPGKVGGSSSEEGSPTQTSGNEQVGLPSNTAQLKHIFGDREGHLPDTEENRRRLLDLANNPEKFKGVDKRGNNWHVDLLPDGSQLWARDQHGVINEGGRNITPRKWNPRTGLFRDIENPFDGED